MNIKSDRKKGMFLAESEHTPGKFYTVDPNKPWCSCFDFRFRESRLHGVCKHITAVREQEDKKRAAEGGDVIAYVRKRGEVDSGELIKEFGEDVVDSLIKRGDLMERKGKIQVLE